MTSPCHRADLRHTKPLSRSTLIRVYQPVRREYKVWISMNISYVIPSLLFNLTVNCIPNSTVKKLRTRAISFIKCWLNISRCAMLASLFHLQGTQPTISSSHPGEGQTEAPRDHIGPRISRHAALRTSKPDL